MKSPKPVRFCFGYQRQGVTDTGETALTATIRCTLRITPPPAVRSAPAALADPIARPVEPLDLSVELSLPFIDSRDGRLQRTTLRPSLERRGDDVILTFEVANRWVRLAYGVLASPGFQGAEQARLAYAFRFECYRKTTGKSVQLLAGLKDGRLPVNWSAAASAPSTLTFHARSGTLTSGDLRIQFSGEPAVAATENRTPSAPASGP